MILITKRTIYIAVLSLICFIPKAYGQFFDERIQKVRDEFENRRKTVLSAFEDRRANINREFSEILGREWKPAGERILRSNPIKEIPSLPQQSASGVVQTPIQINSEATHLIPGNRRPEPLTEIVDSPHGAQSILHSTFYGADVSVRFEVKSLCYLESTDPSGIKTLWNTFSTVDYNNLIADYYQTCKSLELCDWASMLLSLKVSEMVYGNDYSNESIVLQSYILTQCGFMTCLIRDKNNVLHLLVATDKNLEGYPEYNIAGYNMYQVDRKDIVASYTPDEPFVNTVPLRMAFSCPGKFGKKPYKTDKGAFVNENDISFFEDYPPFFDDNDPVSAFSYLASVSLSYEAQETLYPYLRNKIKDLNEVEAVHLLLIYFYNVFPYKTDEEMWGEERHFFPEETLYYGYSDCEDRAILFTRIVRDILGLKTALIYLPGHLSAAVRFNVDVEGDAVISDGDRYLVCDPTYKNAVVGQIMPGWDEKDMRLIVL